MVLCEAPLRSWSNSHVEYRLDATLRVFAYIGSGKHVVPHEVRVTPSVERDPFPSRASGWRSA